MQAIILAAGKGDRMMPLTKNTPKPLLKIANKPMMEYIVELLKYHGFKDLRINLFYLGKKIEKYFGDGSKFGVNIKYVYEKELTGTAGAVKAISKINPPQYPFFVISSDMMINFNLHDIYKFHIQKKATATLCCYFRPLEKLIAGKSGLVVFDEKTYRVKKFIERPKSEKEIISKWVYSSVCILDPKILKFIPYKINGSKVIDLPKNIFPKLLKTHKIYAYPINNKKYYQLGVDTPDRLKKVEDDIVSGKFNPAK